MAYILYAKEYFIRKAPFIFHQNEKILIII